MPHRAGTKSWNTKDGHSPITTFFNSISPISDAAKMLIDRQTYLTSFARGRYLIKPGDAADNLYLVLKGVIRGFLKEKDKEITTWINAENEIVGSIRGLGLKTTTNEYVQAIEAAQLIVIPYSLVEELYEKYPETNIVGRKLLEESYRDAEERAYICRITSAMRRYERFMETKKDLINRIALKYIASYLGMTIETLSRIRSRMAG